MRVRTGDIGEHDKGGLQAAFVVLNNRGLLP